MSKLDGSEKRAPMVDPQAHSTQASRLQLAQHAFDDWIEAMRARDPRRHALWKAFTDLAESCELPEERSSTDR
jgi:hypothetical protein